MPRIVSLKRFVSKKIREYLDVTAGEGIHLDERVERFGSSNKVRARERKNVDKVRLCIM